MDRVRTHCSDFLDDDVSHWAAGHVHDAIGPHGHPLHYAAHPHRILFDIQVSAALPLELDNFVLRLCQMPGGQAICESVFRGYGQSARIYHIRRARPVVVEHRGWVRTGRRRHVNVLSSNEIRYSLEPLGIEVRQDRSTVSARIDYDLRLRVRRTQVNKIAFVISADLVRRR